MWNQLRAGAILRASWLLAFYLAGVAWLTWPLAGSLSSALPCPTRIFMHDIYYSTWVLAHESHALLTAPWRIADANIFHPTPSALFYGPAALGALPLFAPVFLATGNPTLAINLTFLVGLALTGAAMHVVVRRGLVRAAGRRRPPPAARRPQRDRAALRGGAGHPLPRVGAAALRASGDALAHHHHLHEDGGRGSRIPCPLLSAN